MRQKYREGIMLRADSTGDVCKSWKGRITLIQSSTHQKNEIKMEMHIL